MNRPDDWALRVAWDPVKLEWPGTPEAAKFIKGEYRKGWELAEGFGRQQMMGAEQRCLFFVVENSWLGENASSS